VGIGVGLLLIAAGAILAFAVNAEIQGLDVQVVGWILMIIGIIGIVLDLMLWQSWRGYRRAAYVEGEPAPRSYRRPARRTVVEEEEVDAPPPPAPPPPPP
jgi:Domain of unknown function (DUF6458)